MARLRLSISKDEPLRFLGHLDFMRAMERAWRRSGLPLAYSEGFNPHMKVNYDSALGVGVTASALYTDIELVEEIPVAQIQAQLLPQLPTGIRWLSAKYIAPKAPKLMAYINYEEYVLRGPLQADLSEEDLAGLLSDFNARVEIPFTKITPKKTRDIDARPMVPELVEGTLIEGELELRFGIYKTENGAIKPGELWQILIRDHGLPATEGEFISSRLGVYHREPDGRLYSPLAEEAIS